MRLRTYKKADYLFFVLSVALVTYLVLRAKVLALTNDEAYSYHNVKNFWLAELLCTGNSHWFNSAAIKFVILCKFENVAALRWLSILSAIVLVIAVFNWIKSEKKFIAKFLIFSTVLLNPYVLDYLVLARGYASALLFEGLSLALLFSFCIRKQNSLSFLSLLFAGLSALAQFSFVYFFVSYSILYFLLLYRREGTKYFKKIKFYFELLFVILVLALIFRAFLFIQNCSGDVLGAGTTVISEFVATFSFVLLYAHEITYSQIPFMISAFIFGFILLSAFYALVYASSSNKGFYYFSSWLLIFMFLISIFAHFLFGFVLPFQRSAIFLFPIGAICICYFMIELCNKNWFSKLGIVCLLVLLWFNFYRNMQMHSALDYREQADSKKCFDFLEKHEAKNIGVSPEVYGCLVNYYKLSSEFNYSFSVQLINTRDVKGMSSRNNVLENFDYLIVSKPYNLSYYINNRVRLQVENYLPKSGTLILKVN